MTPMQTAIIIFTIVIGVLIMFIITVRWVLRDMNKDDK